MSNTKASATLVTVHISTNLYMIFIFHYLLTYWFCKPSYTVSAVYVHESTCMTVYCHHLKYSYNFIPKNFFSISRGPVGVYKCLSLIVGFAVTVVIWPREVVSCRDFILSTVTTFWAMLLVGIYPGRVFFIAIIMVHLKTNYFLIVSKLDPGVWWEWNEDFAQTLKRCLWQGGKCGKKNTAWMCEMLKSFHEQQGTDFHFRWFRDS